MRPLLLLAVALLASNVVAWRLPSPSRRMMVGRRTPQSQSLPAALYSAPPPVELDGDGKGAKPLVAAPAGYKFVKYDGEALSRLATQQWWRVVARLNEVGLPILNWYALVRSDEMMGKAQLEARQAVHARKLREVLVSLGPTFIKIGQALSNRPDIVGPIYMKELEKLQDTVAPFPDAIAFQIIESELGRPASEIFEFIQENKKGPVASASLGQVYKARVRETGELVAVKVQRPNIFKLAEVDLAILRAGASWLKAARKLRSDLPGIVDEFGETLFEELDYIHEAANARKFRKLYADKLEGIAAPDVVDSLTTKRVMVMEWIEGTKQPQWGADAERLISLGLECSVYQLLETGFLHSDPHPGNLLRTTPAGDLCYLDHGMCTQVSEAQRYGLVRAVSYLYSRDFDRLATTFVDLGFVTNTQDPAALEGLGPALRDAFSNATGGGGEGRGESLLDLNFAKLSSNIADVAYRFPIRIPPYWSLVIRCLTILEGIALNYNPKFRVVKAVYPLVVRFLLRSSGTPVLRIALEEILLMPVQEPPDTFGDYTSARRPRYRIRWSRLERFLRAAAKPTSELLNPGDDQAASSSDGEGPLDATLDGETLDLMLQYILSDNGAYLREALIEDILGAMDDANLVVLRSLSLLSGGLLPPPVAYPDQDRVAVMTQLLRNLQQLALDRGERALESPSALVGATGGALSPLQIQALAQLSRMVLATAVERQSQRALRRVFHGVERAVHSQQRPGGRRV